MNKTLNINLAGLIFHIDENAFNKLESYLDTLKRQFRPAEGGNEIISDIETRIAELFRERTSESKQVINLSDVTEVIEIMGQPEDYLEAEAEASGSEIPPRYARTKRIFRDPDNRIIGGVASGLAAYFNIDPLWLRLVFVLLFFTGGGILIYLIMWLIIPKATTTAEKLMMRGEPVNISNIQRSIKDEFTEMGNTYSRKGAGEGLGGFLNELGRFILEAIRLIFKFIFKVIGFLLLFLGFILLFSIVLSLIVGSVDINGSQVGLEYVMDFLRLVTVDDNHYNMMIVGIILSIAAPVFLMIYFGIRILFDLDPLNRPTKSGLALTTLIGILMLVGSGIKLGREFKEDASFAYDVNLPGYQQYRLTALEDSITKMYDEDYNFNTNWLPLGRRNAFNLVEINVEPTEEEQAYIGITRESQGYSRMQARAIAEEMRYEVILEDSVIMIPPYYLLSEDQKFRAQQIDVVLYLPAGHSVYFDHSVADYLYDVDNLQNMWDYDMAGKLWHMTEEGLSCDGCSSSGDEEALKDSLIDEEYEMLEDSIEEEINEESADNADSGRMALELEPAPGESRSTDDETSVFYRNIARPIEDKVRATTLNILRSHTNFRI